MVDILMKRLVMTAFFLLLTACSTVSPGSKNRAETYCLTKGGTLSAVNGIFGETEFCLLPDESKIEIWKLYLQQHILPQ